MEAAVFPGLPVTTTQDSGAKDILPFFAFRTACQSKRWAGAIFLLLTHGNMCATCARPSGFSSDAAHLLLSLILDMSSPVDQSSSSSLYPDTVRRRLLHWRPAT